MKILVLGGAGGMGQVAVSESARFDFVTGVTVADLNGAAAARVAARNGGKCQGRPLDVSDHQAMRQAIAEHDVVLNTVGPFYVFGVPVLEQVIEAGRHYADVCDDWEPTLEMLALSQKARAKGVVALIGLGASPGVTNLLAMLAARELDEVQEILTGWAIDGGAEDVSLPESADSKSTTAPAAFVHWMQQLTGTIRVLRDGDFQNVKPLESREIHYPGRGALPVCSVGHPEAVSLPRVFPGLSACANVMVGRAESFDGLKMLAELVDNGSLTLREAADEIFKDAMGRKGGRGDTDGASATKPPALFGWARGHHAGRPAVAAAHVRTLPPGGMAGATSVPLSLVLPLFQKGFAGRAGVFTPEELIEPTEFLSMLASRCGSEDAKDGRDFVVAKRVYLDA